MPSYKKKLINAAHTMAPDFNIAYNMYQVFWLSKVYSCPPKNVCALLARSDSAFCQRVNVQYKDKKQDYWKKDEIHGLSFRIENSALCVEFSSGIE